MIDREPQLGRFGNLPFVPVGKERNYFQKHGIEIRELPNGITVIGISRNVEDESAAGITVQFSSGSYFDPPDKLGLHHLTEHLAVNPRLEEEASKIDARLNGATTSDSYFFTLDGVANPGVRQFGVIPLIRGFRKMLANPLNHYSDVLTAIEKEKSVVLNELAERDEKKEYIMSRFRQRTIFTPENPIAQDSGGTIQSVASIRIDDIKGLIESVFIPRGTIVSAFTEGTFGVAFLVDELSEQFNSFPRAGNKNQSVAQNLFDMINPEFDRSGFYENPNNKGENIKMVELIWLLEEQEYTPSAYAMHRLALLLSKKIHDHVRQSGLSYWGHFQTEMAGKHLLAVARFPLERSNHISDRLVGKILPSMRELIQNIDSEELSQLNTSEIYRQLACVMPVRQRLEILLDGLKKYGKIVDADAVKEGYKEISKGNFRIVLDKLLATPVAVFIH